MAAGGNYGMQTFDQCLLNLWKDGFISEDEAQVHADAVNDLRLKMKMTKLESRGEDSSDPGMLTGGMDDDSELKI